MALNPRSPLLVAVDTNVALDLGDERKVVWDGLSTIRSRLRGGSLCVPPTVVEELVFALEDADEDWKRAAARKFFNQHRGWGFQFINFVPLGRDFVLRVARGLLEKQLFPAGELHDARILAEAAALGCSMLLTGDEHLRAIDFERLTFELQAFDLAAPVIATPREIVKKFFR